jgi:hypothetical protein
MGKLFHNLLEKVFNDLNAFIEEYDAECDEQGGIRIANQDIKIVGQAALLLADLPFPLLGTMDLDVINKIPFIIQKKLNELLLKNRMYLDPDGIKAWMPDNTHYLPLFNLSRLQVSFADPASVVLSKARCNRMKDRVIVENYLQHFPAFKNELEKL